MNYFLQAVAWIVGLGVIGSAVGVVVRGREHREGRK